MDDEIPGKIKTCLICNEMSGKIICPVRNEIYNEMICTIDN